MSAALLKMSLIRSRNGAPSRKGCVFNGQMPKAGNKRQQYPPPPLPPLPNRLSPPLALSHMYGNVGSSAYYLVPGTR